MRGNVVLAGVLLAAAIPAQTNYFVSPPAYTSTQGTITTGTNMPYSKGVIQQIHDTIIPTSPIFISELSFRRGGWASSPNTAFAANLSLIMSVTATLAKNMSTTFAMNHGANPTTVISQTNVNFPASQGPTSPMGAPANFDFVIPFPTPFLMPPAKLGLCWELRIHSGTPNRVSLDGVATGGLSGFTFKYFGAGCTASGQTQPAKLMPDSGTSSGSSSGSSYWYKYERTMNLEGYASTYTGGTWVYTMHLVAAYLPQNQPFFWFIGADNQRWGGVPLPWDLTPMGAAGCTIYVPPHMMKAGMTDGSGNPLTFLPSSRLVFLEDPAFAGLSLFHQILAYDPGMPGLPLVATDALELVFPLDQPFARVSSSDDTALTGDVSGEPIITRISY